MSKKETNRFLKRMVRICIVAGAIITGVVLYLWLRLSYVDSSSLGLLFGFWGGELLLSCLTKLIEPATTVTRRKKTGSAAASTPASSDVPPDNKEKETPI